MSTLPSTEPVLPAGTLFEQIQALEGAFPIPVPEAVIEMGSYNAVSGFFQGVVSTLEDPEELLGEELDAPLDKIKVKVPPTVMVDAVEVIIVFRVSPPGANASFTVGGLSVIAGGNDGVVRVRVGRVHRVDWVAQSQGRVYRDTLLIARPQIIGAGAFTLPVLPVTVVYEPPQDAQQRNAASYTVTRAVGTRLSAHFARETSVSAPLDGVYQGPDKAPFGDLMMIKQAMELAASGLGALAEDGPLGIAATALEQMAGLLGSATSSDSQGQADTATGTLEVIGSDGLRVAPTARRGPGLGDLIVFLRNARLVWLSTTNSVRLALLESGPIAMVSAQSLPGAAADFGLSEQSVQSLLALDPFVAGGPQADLPSPRFSFLTGFELGPGASLVQKHSFAVSHSNELSSTRIRLTVSDFEASKLAFFGIGPGQTQTVTSEVTNQNSVSNSQTTVVDTDLQLFNDNQAPYAVGVFFDRVFGTLAFKQMPLATRALVSGTLLDRKSRVRANQSVELKSPRGHWIAVTDARGRFTFSTAAGLRHGPIELRSGRLQRDLRFQGQPLQGIELKY